MRRLSQKPVSFMRVQIVCLSSHPLLARVFAADALAGLRDLYEPLAVPDDPPGVLKDAVQALAATVNGRGVPGAATWPGYAFLVQGSCDVAWRVAAFNGFFICGVRLTKAFPCRLIR